MGEGGVVGRIFATQGNVIGGCYETVATRQDMKMPIRHHRHEEQQQGRKNSQQQHQQQ